MTAVALGFLVSAISGQLGPKHSLSVGVAVLPSNPSGSRRTSAVMVGPWQMVLPRDGWQMVGSDWETYGWQFVGSDSVWETYGWQMVGSDSV